MTDRIKQVVRALADRAQSVCGHYLSNGFQAGNYWRVGNLDNEAGQSLVVRLTGEKAGLWIDNGTDEKGDLLDLIRHRTGAATIGQALDEAEKFLGRSFKEEPRQRLNPQSAKTNHGSHLADDDRAARLARARKILDGTHDLKGTVSARYITEVRHGLVHPRGDALRHHPRLWHPWTETAWPALVGIITDFRDAETFLGVVAIYLNADGTGKAGVEPAKPTWGPVRGGVVRLVPDHEIDTRLNLCEGIETGSTLIKHGWQVWCALTAGNLGSLPVLDGTPDLGIFADNDESGTGQREAANLAKRWSAAGGWSEIYTPPEPGEDWNSVEARQQ